MPDNAFRISDLRKNHTGFSTGATIGATSGRLGYKDSANLTRHIPGAATVAKTASFTATTEDDGKLFEMDSTTSVVITLPLSTATGVSGMELSFVVKQLTSSTGHSFSPNAADFITGNGLTATVDKDLICSAASDRVGDFVTIVAGTGGWWIKSLVGTFAKET